MAAFADTQLQLADEADDFDGVPVNAALRIERKSMGEPDRNKLIKRIFPKFEAAPGTVVNIRIGAADTPTAPETFTPTKLFTIGTDRHMDFTHQGRYFTFEFSSSHSDPWKLTGFDVEHRETGYF